MAIFFPNIILYKVVSSDLKNSTLKISKSGEAVRNKEHKEKKWQEDQKTKLSGGMLDQTYKFCFQQTVAGYAVASYMQITK